MKRQIHAYRGHDEIAVEGHNIKLGRGGIREIEFFVQTQQLIAGGRHPELRGRETLATLDGARRGRLDRRRSARATSRPPICSCASIEHRLQMVADEQTHTLPADREGLERFARFRRLCRTATRSPRCCSAICARCRRHYARAVRGRAGATAGAAALTFPPEARRPRDARPARRDGLSQRRSRSPRRCARWLSGGYPALRSEFGARASSPISCRCCSTSCRALGQSRRRADRRSTSSSPACTAARRLFSLLRQNPDLVALVALRPRHRAAARRHPRAASRGDGRADRAERSSARCRTRPSSTAELDRSLAAGARLRGLSRPRAHVRPGADVPDRRAHPVRHGVGRAGGRGVRAARRRADPRAASRVEDELRASHGRIRGQETALLALGKLGGREMTATSDLDLIIVYDFDAEHPESDGARPLYGAQYFARLTQRLISALTAQTNYGALYQVDMRLRPSGRSGPVATSIDGFAELPGDRGLDLGAHGADARARGLGLAGVRRAGRER